VNGVGSVSAPAAACTAWFVDPYLLRDRLRCAGCGESVQPHQVLRGPRQYACRSGCRMVPLPAEALEAQIWQETCRLVPDRARRAPRSLRAAVIAEVFSRITVGGDVTELAYVRQP
jgi:hypothetical protein